MLISGSDCFLDLLIKSGFHAGDAVFSENFLLGGLVQSFQGFFQVFLRFVDFAFRKSSFCDFDCASKLPLDFIVLLGLSLSHSHVLFG